MKERPIDTTVDQKAQQIEEDALEKEREYFNSLNPNDQELFGFYPGSFTKRKAT